MVGASDEDASFHFALKPEEDPEFLSNQVDDEEIGQSKSTTSQQVAEDNREDGGAGGDTKVTISALQKLQGGGGGEDTPFAPEDKQKLNELLDKIEEIAEK